MKYAELRQTAFGQVVAELMESRDLEVTPFQVGKLGEKSGLDGWRLINRMADAGAADPGDLDGLASDLDLTRAERDKLALAYAFEQRRGA